MFLQPLIGLLVIQELRRSLKRDGQLEKWNTISKIALGVYGALIILSTTSKDPWHIINWVSHILLLSLICLVFSKREFRSGRPLVFAFLPLIIIFLTEDIATAIDPGFEKRWQTYFDTAVTFGFIWMGAMLFINRRQKKALEKERVKTEEKEREYKAAEAMKATLEIQVKERTAEILLQKEELQHALEDLKATQSQLVHSEKMASLGELTAGIAHEIQNPLNFVNNFSEVNKELIEELKNEKAKVKDERDEKLEVELLNDIEQNLEKINFHGKRADAIVKGMLQHSRTSSGQKEPTDINALCDEYLRLSYHGLRAKNKSFNAKFETYFDESLPKVNIVAQDIGRVVLNLINNAFYAVNEKLRHFDKLRAKPGNHYEPTVSVKTRNLNGKVEISVKDNGSGIPDSIKEKIFQPFFTTKPSGQGTGLGLSLSYDIITKGHAGKIEVTSVEDEGTIFTIILPE